MQHGGSVVSTVASQQEGPGFDPQLEQGLSVWSLHVLSVSVWVSSHHQDMRHIGLGWPSVASLFCCIMTIKLLYPLLFTQWTIM